MEILLFGVGVVAILAWFLSQGNQGGGSPAQARRPQQPIAGEGTLVGFEEVVEVVGESNYQAALNEVSGGKTPDGPAVSDVWAELVPEPNNPYDKNAVRVEISGQLVGYLPRRIAARLSSPLSELPAPVVCRARITGGWDRGGGDVGSFGVVLLDQEDEG